jgi:hypothetical protein
MRSLKVLLLLVPFLLSAHARPTVACVGDCSGDGTVTVAELVSSVATALGREPIDDCPTIDRNGNGVVTVDELLTAVSSSMGVCPIFPADYRKTYVEVRDCRSSPEHGGVVRVLASPNAVRPYKDGANPLPVGSVIVKEEFSRRGCEDEDLVRWRVMRKEAPGFDPEDGDWHWQWVESSFAVRFDDKTTGDCITCHREPDCLARDYMCTVGARGDLQLILENVSGALLSIAGTSSSDVYAVGADPHDDKGPYVLHYNGESWERLETGATGDLWWLSVTPIDGSFYMAGDGGLILEYDLTTRQFHRFETPGTSLLFGIWGPAENDLYACGVDQKAGGGVVWHFDGKEWTVVDLSNIRGGGVLPALNKIWGRSASEVYAVGEDGFILFFNGKSWSEIESPTDRFLFTVHGNDSLVTAVGGFFTDSVIIESGEGQPFVAVPGTGAQQLNGVFIAPDGFGAAVGKERTIALREDGIWKLHDSVRREVREYHAVWIDPEDGIWAVGGDLGNLEDGVLAYSGELTIGRQIRTGEE